MFKLTAEQSGARHTNNDIFGREARQIFDSQEPKLAVIEHRLDRYCDAMNGKQVFLNGSMLRRSMGKVRLLLWYIYLSKGIFHRVVREPSSQIF